MAKQQKIKRYSDRQRTFKARPRPLGTILTIILLAGLVALGMMIYEPVKDFISQILNPPPVSTSVPAPAPPPMSSSEEASAPPEQPKAPEKIRAAMMPHETAVYQSGWDAFIAELPVDVNTIMIELKSAEGVVNITSAKTSAVDWGATAEDPISLKMLAEYLEDKGYCFAVRISAFADPFAARALRGDGAIMYDEVYTWLDNTPENGGRSWLNPFAPMAREYVVSLATEAAEAGAVLVLLDHVQFPLDYINTADYGEFANVTRAEALAALTSELKNALEPHGARGVVYLPVGSLNLPEPAGNAAYYGGSPLEIVGGEAALGMHLEFLEGETSREKLQNAANAKALTDEHGITLIPVLTATEEVTHNEQIKIIEALGFEEYILY